MVKLYCITAILFCSFLSVAQSNFQKGLIVTNTADTITGFIDQREWDRNPKSISFKKAIDGAVENYSIKDINFFEVNEVSYQRWFLSISMDEVDIQRNISDVKHDNVSDSVFLKVLQDGKNVAFFSYRDKVKIRYFLADKGSLPYELIFRQSRDGKNISNIHAYRNQLMLSAKSHDRLSEKLLWKIKKTTYGTSSILPVVKEINDFQKTDKNTKEKTNTIGQKKMNYFVGAGLSRSSLSYKGDTHFAKSASSKAFSSPYFSIGADKYINPSVGKIILRGELNFAMVKNTTLATDNSYQYAQHIKYNITAFSSSISGMLIYNIYNSNKFKYYLGAGFKFSKLRYKHNLYTIWSDDPVYKPSSTIDFFNMNKNLYSIPIQIGVVLMKKIEIKATYNYSFLSLNQNALFISEYYHNLQIGVNYFIR